MLSPIMGPIMCHIMAPTMFHIREPIMGPIMDPPWGPIMSTAVQRALGTIRVLQVSFNVALECP